MILTDSQSLPLLPDNVVYHIFKFLSLPERKNARLVCKQWHGVSNRRRFAESEAFFIPSAYELGTAVKVLVKCEPKMLNLKFDDCKIDSSWEVLWSRCGQRIQSLQFNCCNFPLDFSKRIFVDCKNLNEFSCDGGSVGDSVDYNNHGAWDRSMLEIDDDVVAPKLRTLHLNSWCMALKERDLRLISSAFPQLNDLSIYLRVEETNVIRESTENNFTVLVNLLNSGLKNLEKLCVHFPDRGQDWGLINFSSIPQFNCDRLKNVSMSLGVFVLRGDSLNKILHYKFWTSLDIATHVWCDDEVLDTSDIIVLLNENPLLEKLYLPIKFSTASDFSDLFKALVKSRLKSLKIYAPPVSWSPEEAKLFVAAVAPLLEGLAFNNTVERLFVSNAEFNSLFLQYFRNIRYLEMPSANVNTIFKYQKNLKSLKIESLAIPTDEPPVRRSIESLEFMDIVTLELDVFTTYQFPNLKYLVVDDSNHYKHYDASIRPAVHNVNEENGDNAPNYDNCKEEFVWKINKLMSSIFRGSPLLEGIEFRSDCLLDLESCAVFFQSCLYFHHLRYVSFRSCSFNDWSFSSNIDNNIDREALEHEVAKYFKNRPSFRRLWIDTSLFKIFFYFNIVTKKYDFKHYDVDDRFAVNGPDFYQFWRYKR